MIRSFWETQWPSGGERERDASIKAVLNKLGAFVTYDSIRLVVGQGVSTIRPREIMDRGEVLLVDLSGVGGDNATLFGAMLASRYYVDAVGRQELPPWERRQHLLLIDEAHRFATRAVENTLVEGRKFGLALGLASQSLGGLGERLSRSVLTNAATIALLAPGSEDVRTLARLFAPVTASASRSTKRPSTRQRSAPGSAPTSVPWRVATAGMSSGSCRRRSDSAGSAGSRAGINGQDWKAARGASSSMTSGPQGSGRDRSPSAGGARRSRSRPLSQTHGCVNARLRSARPDGSVSSGAVAPKRPMRR